MVAGTKAPADALWDEVAQVIVVERKTRLTISSRCRAVTPRSVWATVDRRVRPAPAEVASIADLGPGERDVPPPAHRSSDRRDDLLRRSPLALAAWPLPS